MAKEKLAPKEEELVEIYIQDDPDHPGIGIPFQNENETVVVKTGEIVKVKPWVAKAFKESRYYAKSKSNETLKSEID
jgi:hypothetical protein